jgi:hypothetical protein
MKMILVLFGFVKGADPNQTRPTKTLRRLRP